MKWAKKYNKCISCGTTESKHQAKGMCKKCYNKKYSKVPENVIRANVLRKERRFTGRTNKKHKNQNYRKAYQRKYRKENAKIIKAKKWKYNQEHYDKYLEQQRRSSKKYRRTHKVKKKEVNSLLYEMKRIPRKKKDILKQIKVFQKEVNNLKLNDV